MEVHLHKHHICNPRFGKLMTRPIGDVPHSRAIWIFTPIWDIVIWI